MMVCLGKLNKISMKIIKQFVEGSKGKIAIAIHTPKEQISKLAILCPGYLDSKDYAGLVALADALCEHGYTVVRMDSTGVWESEGNIEDYTVSQYLSDVTSVLDYMLLKDNYEEILLSGHSRGALVAILYAAKNERVTKVLAIMPSYGFDIRDKWDRNGIRLSRRDLVNNSELNREYAVPISYMDDIEQYRPIESVQKIHVPIVFISGELDDVVLSKDVKALYDLANEPKYFAEIKGVEHDYRLDVEQVKKLTKKAISLLNTEA